MQVIKWQFLNQRIKFDGVNCFVSVGTETDTEKSNNTLNIEIDLGIKNLAICSDGKVVAQ